MSAKCQKQTLADHEAQIPIEGSRRYCDGIPAYASLCYGPPAPEVFVAALTARPTPRRRVLTCPPNWLSTPANCRGFSPSRKLESVQCRGLQLGSLCCACLHPSNGLVGLLSDALG